MKKLLFIISILTFLACGSQNTDAHDKEIILSIIEKQEQAWNNYDLEAFMEGYWNSDSLKFYGASGITYGYDKTLANYHKRYPSKEHTGTLTFKINNLSKVTVDSYFVMGEYHLVRSVGNADGIFMIIFKRIDGKWKIVADTSC